MAKMWSAMTAEKFAKFPDLKSVLRYLQMCVHSVIMDEVRRGDQTKLSLDDDELIERIDVGEDSHAEATLERVDREGVWALIGARLKDDKERQVVYGSFVLGLKPRELAERFADTFQDVREVYRVKENVLARLRRDTELRKLLELDT
jgi:DNA-directed RNA polymerase specialized sigma24 family protein